MACHGVGYRVDATSHCPRTEGRCAMPGFRERGSDQDDVGFWVSYRAVIVVVLALAIAAAIILLIASASAGGDGGGGY